MIAETTSEPDLLVGPLTTGSPRARPLPHIRQARILAALATNGSVQVAIVAAELAVSEMTVRRDLIDLETAGKLVRIHGGAIALGRARPVDIDRDEPSFDARLQRNRLAKENIAAAAATLCAGCRTIALDVGTTTYLVAPLLQERDHTKIFTSSVRIAAQLGSSLPEVYLPGGRMRRDEMSICGPTAISEFQALWFDIAFLGVSGITADGLYDYSFEDADMKRVFLRRSGLKVVLCDASKFRRMSLVHIARLKDIDVLITDADPPAEIAAALVESNVQIQVAPGIPTAA